MWSNGVIGIPGEGGEMVSIKYWCKHFDEPSEFGIEEGRISKLELMQSGSCVYSFDRGLDLEPQTAEAENALAILMYEYN